MTDPHRHDGRNDNLDGKTLTVPVTNVAGSQRATSLTAQHS